jgi:iron complex outermembrane recepter protein
VGLFVLLANTAAGQQNLADASLEQLLNTQVTSASKKEEKLSGIAAAVFVIGAEDIRRSGATNLPDVLRLAPGVDVQQVDASVWAISIRGFNSRFSNKVLVTIDGRSVYSPSFSGVYWDQQMLPLQEIERIEVIRGPGATVWGANAVNGVINIFTKSAKTTEETTLSALGGSQTQTLDLAQFGAAAGSAGAYRVFGQFSRIGNSGRGANDRWSSSHGGFRSDWDLSARDSLTVTGDLFVNQEHASMRSDWLDSPWDTLSRQQVDSWGGSLMARWDHATRGIGQTSLQTSYTAYQRTEFGVPEKVKELSLEFQHHWRLGSRHDIVWGLSLRNSSADVEAGHSVGFSPPSGTARWFGAFIQDEIRITPSISLTLGDRFERADSLHSQDEPSARIAWMPGAGRHTFWASIANADRQPSRVETSIQLDLQTVDVGPNTVSILRVLGNPQVKNEQIEDYEAGYRAALTQGLTVDIAGFFSRYHDLCTWEPGPPTMLPGSPSQIVAPLRVGNLARASDYGGEVSVNWSPVSRWRLRPGYSYLHAMVAQDSSAALTTASVSTGFPQHQIQLRSLVNVSRNVEFDQTLYYTAHLPGGTLPGHTRLDLRLSRRFGESVEASIAGQNLLRNRTFEFGDAYNLAAGPAMRSVYGRITWVF